MTKHLFERTGWLAIALACMPIACGSDSAIDPNRPETLPAG